MFNILELELDFLKKSFEGALLAEPGLPYWVRQRLGQLFFESGELPDPSLVETSVAVLRKRMPIVLDATQNSNFTLRQCDGFYLKVPGPVQNDYFEINKDSKKARKEAYNLKDWRAAWVFLYHDFNMLYPANTIERFNFENCTHYWASSGKEIEELSHSPVSLPWPAPNWLLFNHLEMFRVYWNHACSTIDSSTQSDQIQICSIDFRQEIIDKIKESTSTDGRAIPEEVKVFLSEKLNKLEFSNRARIDSEIEDVEWAIIDGLDAVDEFRLKINGDKIAIFRKIKSSARDLHLEFYAYLWCSGINDIIQAKSEATYPAFSEYLKNPLYSWSEMFKKMKEYKNSSESSISNLRKRYVAEWLNKIALMFSPEYEIFKKYFFQNTVSHESREIQEDDSNKNILSALKDASINSLRVEYILKSIQSKSDSDKVIYIEKLASIIDESTSWFDKVLQSNTPHEPDKPDETDKKLILDKIVNQLIPKLSEGSRQKLINIKESWIPTQTPSGNDGSNTTSTSQAGSSTASGIQEQEALLPGEQEPTDKPDLPQG